MYITRDDLQATASALQNLDGYIMQQIAKDARSDLERIQMESNFQGNVGGAYERLRGHFAGKLTEQLRAQTVQLQNQTIDLVQSAQDARQRQEAAWQNGIKRDEYAFQHTR